LISRIRKSIDERDGGFTLIELLVVMIIIGILAAIAIPVFLNQRKKAVDSAAKADVSTLGKEVATYYVDGTVVPVVGITSGRYTLTPTGGSAQDLGRVSSGVTAASMAAAPTATAWCVQVTYAGGSITQQHYSYADGLATGACP